MRRKQVQSPKNLSWQDKLPSGTTILSNDKILTWYVRYQYASLNIGSEYQLIITSPAKDAYYLPLITAQPIKDKDDKFLYPLIAAKILHFTNQFGFNIKTYQLTTTSTNETKGV